MATAQLVLAIFWALSLFGVTALALLCWGVAIGSLHSRPDTSDGATLMAFVFTVISSGGVLWTLAKAGIFDVWVWLGW